MRKWLRSVVEDLLPWWDATHERLKNAKTERIRVRSIGERIKAERIIAQYESASEAAGIAGRALVNELRRDDR